MFNVLTLKQMETFDTQPLPTFNMSDTLSEPVLVTTNDAVIDPETETLYTYVPNEALSVSDWSSVDFTDPAVWFTPSSASQEEKNLTGGDDTIDMSYGRLVAMGGGGADTLRAIGSYNTGNGGKASAIFAGDSAHLSLTSDPDEWKVQLFESRRGPDGDLNLTGTGGTNADGRDVIDLEYGHLLAIGGEGDDSIRNGDGSAIVLGDHGEMDFAVSNDHKINTVTNAARTDVDESALLTRIAGDDTIELGQGSLQIVMGGDGEDTVTTQMGRDGTLQAGAALNDSYFAGDRAELVFDPTAEGAKMLRFTAKSDLVSGDGNDTFTTADGDLRAILGAGADTLVQGDGLGYVLGDLGVLHQDNPAYILGRIEAAPLPFTFETGDDSWTAGDGEHVAIMGAGDDTVRLGGGPVQVLLDHGYTLRDVTNAKLIHTEDETAEGWGNDSLIAGSGWGFVIGGGGNDMIATGRTDQDAPAAVDGRHILLGDAGYIDFDPILPGEMELVRIEAYLPQISGNDSLWSGAGNDVVIGGAGSDQAHGEVGRDFVAGDFLLIEYEQGLERNVITQRDYYAAGADDLVTTGYDGDFVFGGTQSNTMGVAASIDIIFETFGRILFEQGRGIDKVERIFNMGIASSLLNDRVRDGQLSVSGTTTEVEETAKAEPDTTIPLIAEGDNAQIAAFEIEGGGLSRGASTSDQANLEETTDVDDTAQSAAARSQQHGPADIAVEPRKFARDPGAVPVAPAVQVVFNRTGNEGWMPQAVAARVKTIEEQEEMLNFLEGSVLVAAAAGSYRQYGKPRSVGSLEQRLRVWTENGFLLRGNGSQDTRL